MVLIAALPILVSLIISSNCCFSKQNEEVLKQNAELKFPGVTDLAVRKSSKDAAEFIALLAKNLPRVSFGQLVGPTLAAVSVMGDMLSAAKSELGKFVYQSLAIHAIGDVQAKVVTIQHLLQEVEEDIRRGQSFNKSITLTEQKCEEVLQKFSQDWNYLYQRVNYVFSAPSLVSFAGVYAGVAGFRLILTPERHSHTINRLKLLKQVLEKYRDATVSKRMKYVEFLPDNSLSIFQCSDSYFEVTFCPSCSKASCIVPMNLKYHKEPSYICFRTYEDQLKNLYSQYFNEPLEKLGELIQTLENKKYH